MSGISSLGRDPLSVIYERLPIEDAANFSQTCKWARNIFCEDFHQKRYIRELGCELYQDTGRLREQLLRLRKIKNGRAADIPLVLTHKITLPKKPKEICYLPFSDQLDIKCDQAIQTFNPRTGSFTTVLESPIPIHESLLCRSGNRLLALMNGTIESHDIHGNKHVLGKHSGPASIKTLGQNYLVTHSSNDKDLRIYNHDTKELIDTLLTLSTAARGVRDAIVSGNQIIVSYIGLSGIYLWDLTSNSYHILEAPFEEVSGVEPEGISLQCNDEQLVVRYDTPNTVIWDLTTQEPTRLSIKCLQVQTMPGNPNIIAIREGILQELIPEEQALILEEVIRNKNRMSIYHVAKKEFLSRSGTLPITNFMIYGNQNLALVCKRFIQATCVSTGQGLRVEAGVIPKLAVHPTQNVLISASISGKNIFLNKIFENSSSLAVITLNRKTSHTLEEPLKESLKDSLKKFETISQAEFCLSSAISSDGLHYFLLLFNRVLKSYEIAPLPEDLKELQNSALN